MEKKLEVTLEGIPFIKKSEDLANHCVHKARLLSRLIRDNPHAFIPLSDRFYLMSKGYIPFVSRPKWSYRENLPVTLVATTTTEDKVAQSNSRFPTHKQGDDITPLTNWNKLGG